jgi:hypothetical protein
LNPGRFAARLTRRLHRRGVAAARGEVDAAQAQQQREDEERRTRGQPLHRRRMPQAHEPPRDQGRLQRGDRETREQVADAELQPGAGKACEHQRQQREPDDREASRSIGKGSIRVGLHPWRSTR